MRSRYQLVLRQRAFLRSTGRRVPQLPGRQRWYCAAATAQAAAGDIAAGLQYGPIDEDDGDDDDDDDEQTDWAPPLGTLLLTHAVRGVFRQPPPDPPVHVTRRLRHLARLRGEVELEREWKALQQAHVRAHGDPSQGRRYQKCKRAHRDGQLRWATADGCAASPLLGPAALPSYSAEAAEAYAWRRFVPSHAHHMRIMQEVSEALGQSYAPRRVIDFGCGPGSGLAAAAQIWPHSVRELVGVDTSAGMRVAADILLAPDEDNQWVFPKDGDAPAAEINAPSVRLEQSLDDALCAVPASTPGFDLAIISSTLSELSSDVERAEAVRLLWAALEDNGVLIVQDHGGAIGTCFVSQPVITHPLLPGVHYFSQMEHLAMCRRSVCDRRSQGAAAARHRRKRHRYKGNSRSNRHS